MEGEAASVQAIIGKLFPGTHSHSAATGVALIHKQGGAVAAQTPGVSRPTVTFLVDLVESSTDAAEPVSS